MVKVLICGSRGLKPSDRLLDRLLSGIEVTEIIEGDAIGVDRAAKEYAQRRGITVTTMKPDWQKYGRGAGLRRNSEMVERCDIGVAIWDGRSRGTLDSINKLKKLNKSVIIYQPKRD